MWKRREEEHSQQLAQAVMTRAKMARTLGY